MIYNVAFSGREAMLTRGTKEAKEAAAAIAGAANKYVSAGKVYNQSEIEAVERAVQNAEKADAERLASGTYTSPFASTTVNAKDTIDAINAKAAISAKAAGESYAVAHGIPNSEVQKLSLSV